MSKKRNIIIFLLLLSLALVLYLILTSEAPARLNILSQKANDETAALAEENYKAEIKEIFSAYEKLAKDNGFTPEKISELKNQTQVLKAPAKKFIELHTDLFLALSDLEEYLNKGYERGKDASLEKISQLKADYSWLNN